MASRLGHEPFAETADPAVVSGAIVAPIAGGSSYSLPGHTPRAASSSGGAASVHKAGEPFYRNDRLSFRQRKFL